MDYALAGETKSRRTRCQVPARETGVALGLEGGWEAPENWKEVRTVSTAEPVHGDHFVPCSPPSKLGFPIV